MDAIRYEQFGWKDNYSAFLVGNSLIHRGGAATFAYGSPGIEKRMRGFKLLKIPPARRGRSPQISFTRRGLKRMALPCLLVSPRRLWPLFAVATDGGAIMALHTEGSGFGKTNSLQAIASVWGHYDALGVSGTDTENAKFALISIACNLPVYEEEMGKNDPIKDAAIIKRFVGGKDKNRAQRDGSIEYKETRFKTLMISASNHSLADILQKSGDKGAMARVFEINIDTPTDKELFKRIF